MSQHDMNIADQAGAAFLADLNAALPAIASQNSGPADPATTFAYQRFARTDLGVILRRNAANSGDLLDGTLAETFGVAKSATFTAGLADFKRLFVCTGTWSLDLDAAATLRDGWYCMVKNNGSGVITLNPNASETIDGAATLDISAGQSCIVYCDGTKLFTVGVLAISQAAADARYARIISGIPAGTIIDFAGTAAPSGYLACPTAAGGAQLVSRTTYAALFAAIGTAWGVGDGSTTFGIPWFAANYAAVQANANVGTNTVGAVIAHAHSGGFIPTNGVTTGATVSGLNIAQNTGSTGGSANLAAGVRVLKCIKY